MNMEYYNKKEKYQKKFKQLENEMCECFRTGDNETLEKVNQEYGALTIEYKKEVTL